MEKEENVYEEVSQTEEFAEASENGALTVLGKFKDVGALARAYESLQAEFTRRSQKLRQLERESENFKKAKEESSGVEKLRKTAKAKREEQKEFDMFIADMVTPSEENWKPDAAPMGEGKHEEGADAQANMEEVSMQNKEVDNVVEEEKFAFNQAAIVAVEEAEKQVGEVATSSAVGSKAKDVVDDLFERAVNDEAVRLRIIGEYLASLQKSNAPLTATGGGTFAAPPMKAKTVNEAGDMALLYFKKPVI